MESTRKTRITAAELYLPKNTQRIVALPSFEDPEIHVYKTPIYMWCFDCESLCVLASVCVHCMCL